MSAMKERQQKLLEELEQAMLQLTALHDQWKAAAERPIADRKFTFDAAHEQLGRILTQITAANSKMSHISGELIDLGLTKEEFLAFVTQIEEK